MEGVLARAKSQQTRERILVAAERLFADRGFAGASMRDITAEAKVNLSVAYYYFENKETLLLAVLEKYILPVMAKEQKMLESARANAGTLPISPRKLVEAAILPRTECVSETAHQLFSILFARRGAFERKIFLSLEKLTKELHHRFFEEFQRTFPNLSPEELSFRMTTMGALLNGWRIIEPFVKSESAMPVSQNRYLEMFTTLTMQIFSAPPTFFPAKNG